MLSFKTGVSLSSFTFIFSSSLLSAIRVVSSAYPRLLIFVMAILKMESLNFSPKAGYSGWTVKMGFYGLVDSNLGEGNGNPLQCSCLENPVDIGAWCAAVHRVAQNWTRLKRLSSSSSRSYLACMHASEKEMATHSSVLAWSIPGTGEPGGLPSMGLHRVGHN